MQVESKLVFVFDAFGTLFDVAGLARRFDDEVPAPDALVASWRAKQLEYSFVRTMTGRYVDFEAVTRDALRFSMAIHNVNASDQLVQAWTDRWSELEPYPEAAKALRSLEDRTRVILSNGSPGMLDRLLQASDLASDIDRVISADDVARFKPDCSVYALVPATLGMSSEHVLFVTANGFDIAGARSFGFDVCRVNRDGNPPERNGWEANIDVRDLAELVELAGR